MNVKQFDEIVKNRLEHCSKILCSKGDEYATDVDRLHNFKVAAAMKGESESKALYGMFTKHLVSMQDLAFNPETATTHLIKEKLTDVINYTLLLEAVLIEYMDSRAYKGARKKQTPATISRGQLSSFDASK